MLGELVEVEWAEQDDAVLSLLLENNALMRGKKGRISLTKQKTIAIITTELRSKALGTCDVNRRRGNLVSWVRVSHAPMSRTSSYLT